MANEKHAKVGDALRGGISWRCTDVVDPLLRPSMTSTAPDVFVLPECQEHVRDIWGSAGPELNKPLDQSPALPKRSRLEEVRLYLDNDDAGSAASRKLVENALDASKLSDMRSNYADLNAWLFGEKL